MTNDTGASGGLDAVDDVDGVDDVIPPTAANASDLAEVRKSLALIIEAQRQSMLRPPPASPRGKRRSFRGNASRRMDFGKSARAAMRASFEKSDGEDEEQYIERTCVHMDGLEVYAVVSALTVATSLSLADSGAARMASARDGFSSPGAYWLFRKAFFLSSTASALLGLHATLVFSLVTMYGRTAVGVDNMPAFESFYQSTTQERNRGFRSFLHSIYAFLLQIVLVVIMEFREYHGLCFPLFGFVLTSLAALKIYRDTENICNKAGIIFAPRGAEESSSQTNESKSKVQ